MYEQNIIIVDMLYHFLKATSMKLINSSKIYRCFSFIFSRSDNTSKIKDSVSGVHTKITRRDKSVSR